MIDLSKQKAIVTGGSRGIGAATANLLAEAGADVAIVFREDYSSAHKVIRKITEFRRNGIEVRGRVESYENCMKIVNKIIKKFNRVDILVNCAGVWEFGEIDRMSVNQWNRTISINLTGTFNMCRVVIPFMKKQKYGRIINISSTAGQRGEQFHSHYAASKGGINAFTKSLSVELVKYGILVNCIAPGWVQTDMIKREISDPRKRSEILKGIPRGKIASPEDIAGPIVFLASKLSNHIVGEIINVNGGSVLCG
ncbi:MAG TPA: SDR family oxidoreductase [Bacteroidota bacterium]|nr:SDR family oxidoreductase [Bacteroidota bacterium]